VPGYVTLLAHVPGPPLVGNTLLGEHTTAVHAVLEAPDVPVYPIKHEPHVLVTFEQEFRLREPQDGAPEQSIVVEVHVRPSLPRVKPVLQLQTKDPALLVHM